MNLNYDTVFEIALSQLGIDFQYSPNKVKGKIKICKPHGSLNMVINDTSFTFGQPEWLGTPEPEGFKSFSGFVPPRKNKSYEQHQVAKNIIRSVESRRPHILTFWGVGLTNSDTDLVSLYKGWAEKCKYIEVINIDESVASRIDDLLGVKVFYFSSIDEWMQKNKKDIKYLTPTY